MKSIQDPAGQQNTTLPVESNSMPFIKSLLSCLNRIKADGYTENFVNTSSGIHASASGDNYLPEDFIILNYFKFQGDKKVGNIACMYLIETADGLKGTLLRYFDSITYGNNYSAQAS